MAEKIHNQQDFSGGEVSYDLIFRDNLLLHSKSLAEMLNFMPSLQGSAIRTPGTRFIQEVAGNPNTSRILPYITPTGNHALVLLTPKVGETLGDAVILENINGAAQSPAELLSYSVINENHSFVDGYATWQPIPVDYISRKGNAQLGWSLGDKALVCQLRRGHDIPNSDPLLATLLQSFSVPETTDHIMIRPDFNYFNNFGRSNGVNYGITIVVRVGTTAYGFDVGSFTVSDMQRGGPSFTEIKKIPGTFTAGATLYLSLEISANAGPGGDGNAVSHPIIAVHELHVLSLVTQDIGDTSLSGVVPYKQAELKDVHFVQSPYTSVDILGHGAGKELVMTHANVPPMRLYLNGASYVYEEVFSDNATQFYEQWGWSVTGYPAACTSFSGRLVLAGSSDGSIASSNGSSSETVWCTVVGDWARFTDESAEEILPEDSVTFATIYRSPIRWVVGQNVLMVGAESMEYTASADTIFQPADQGVNRQSTHGSNRVQPVTMGKVVMFPAEAGVRLRAAQFNAEAENNWVAPDITLAHPRLLSSGIVRLVRMRNPHQMAIAVMGNGQLAVLSYDETAQVAAWSRIDVGGNVIDAAVLVNQGNVFEKGGEDILYLLVKRVVQGVEKTYIEAINQWVIGKKWVYMNSYVNSLAFLSTNVISGLDHLEGKFVQVVADENYMGTYQVSGGEVELIDQFGDPVPYVGASAGLASPCRIQTLPLASADPRTTKRFTNLTVQTIGSIRPIINGERPNDRDPKTLLGSSQYRDVIGTNTVATMGSDQFQVVTIEETVPMDLTISRIYGKVTENSV